MTMRQTLEALSAEMETIGRPQAFWKGRVDQIVQEWFVAPDADGTPAELPDDDGDDRPEPAAPAKRTRKSSGRKPPARKVRGGTARKKR